MVSVRYMLFKLYKRNMRKRSTACCTNKSNSIIPLLKCIVSALGASTISPVLQEPPASILFGSMLTVMYILYLSLTRGGLVMPCGVMDLSQHWSLYWLVAGRHQPITWRNADVSSVGYCVTDMKAIALVMLMKLITVKIVLSKSKPIVQETRS